MGKRVMKRRSIFILVVLLLLYVPWCHAAPKAKLWKRWQTFDASSSTHLDHKSWDLLLQKYVVTATDGINRFAYGKVTSKDRIQLEKYLADMAVISISRFNRAEQKAYWINLYNALTIRVILDHYPVKSIRDIDISPGFFADGPWGKKLLRVEGEGVSLNDIEHRILRPVWRDNRLHYAVNCASLGCPNLQAAAFTAENTETLLEKGAREYVNHPRGVRIEKGKLFVSSIYEWFKEDFGDSDQGVIAHLKQYAAPALQQQLQKVQRIADDAYNWQLNE